MITGDLAVDAWLYAHGWDLAVAWLTVSVVALLLPGLIALFGKEES